MTNKLIKACFISYSPLNLNDYRERRPSLPASFATRSFIFNSSIYNPDLTAQYAHFLSSPQIRKHGMQGCLRSQGITISPPLTSPAKTAPDNRVRPPSNPCQTC